MGGNRRSRAVAGLPLPPSLASSGAELRYQRTESVTPAVAVVASRATSGLVCPLPPHAETGREGEGGAHVLSATCLQMWTTAASSHL